LTTRIGSLFTGFGGLDLAAQDVLGGDVVWHCDIKPAAVALLEHRFPGVPNLGDITAIDWTRVSPVDLLTFGWPCQPHSSAGLRLGEADPRALLPEVLRCVAHLRPRVLLGENVARVTSNGELRRALRALAQIGYVGAWRCVTAAEVGAPHRRDRLALVAVRADAVADALSGGLEEHAQRDGASLGGPGAPPLGVDAVRRGARGADRLTLLLTPHQNRTTGAGPQGRDGGLNLQTAVTLLPTPKASDGPKGGPGMRGSSFDLSMPSAAVLMDGSRWGVYAAAVQRWEHILGRAAPPPTQISPRTGKPQLAPPFVEWMMGLPAGWVTDVPNLAPRPAGARNAMLSLLGDGVVPAQLAHGFRLAFAELAAAQECAA
jgi:DNA (cytosine-5)-methyltransferase 1